MFSCTKLTYLCIDSYSLSWQLLVFLSFPSLLQFINFNSVFDLSGISFYILCLVWVCIYCIVIRHLLIFYGIFHNEDLMT